MVVAVAHGDRCGMMAGLNFLAHLYLAEDSAASMIGNVLPDLVRGPVDPALDPRVLAGARLHRQVDAFSDTHPIFARSRARLRERHGIFASILVDLFYDHVLAANWGSWHRQPLPEFVSKAHQRFESHRHLMPVPMQVIVTRLVEQDWLSCYATVEGMQLVLWRMSRRLSARFSRPVHLESAVRELRTLGPELADDFDAFFPELIEYAAQRRDSAFASAPTRASGA